MGKKSREKQLRKIEGYKKEKVYQETGTTSFCLKIIEWGVYFILFTTLLISGKFFFPYVGFKSLYFMAIVEIIFAVYLYLAITSSKYRPKFNFLLSALALFLAFLILSSIFGADFSNSFWSKYERMTGLLMWFHLFAFFTVITSVFKKKQDWYKIFGVSLFVAVLISLMSLLPKIGFGISSSTRGGATIGNTSFLATYLLFNVFLAFYLFLKTKSYFRIYSAGASVFIVLALLLSGGRAAILSFFGGLVLLIFLYLAFKAKKHSLNILGKILLAGSLIIFLGFAFFLFQPESIVQQKFVEKATKARLIVWDISWKAWQEKPLFGWGPENFNLVFTKYFHPCMSLPECGGEIWFDRAHNIIFDTLITVGIIGFLSYLGIFVSVFYLLWRRYFKEKLDFWTAGIFSVLLISYSVQNLTVFDMVNSYMMLFLILGFIAVVTQKKEEENASFANFSQKNWTGIIILICFIFCFSKFIIQPLKTDYYVISTFHARTFDEKMDFYKKTLETSPMGKYQIREFFAEQLMGFVKTENARKVPKEKFKQEFDFVSAELEKSIVESPLNFRAHLKLGQIYNAYIIIDFSKNSRAQEILEKAIELSPTNQQGYWALAQTKLHQGDYETALSLAQQALDLEPRIVKSHFIMIDIAQKTGDKDLAKKHAQEAIKLDASLEPKLQQFLSD